jgi:hypothetical protein
MRRTAGIWKSDCGLNVTKDEPMIHTAGRSMDSEQPIRGGPSRHLAVIVLTI